jgi:hypothetical protein
MSELEPQVRGPEHLSGAENSVEQQEKLERLKQEAKEARNELAESKETLSHAAKEEALLSQEVQGKIAETEKPKHESFAITRSTKRAAYKKTLRHIQHQLPKSERTFSKLIHQPVVEKLSDVGAKTVARPSGILSGGICALIGSSLVFYMSKHYGFRYNFFVFILLLVLGFGLGLVIELFWSGTKKLRKH